MPTARYLDHPYLLAGRRIDPITGTLSYREVQKHLRRKELEVLALLAEAGGEQVARSVFIEQVWQGNPIVGEQGLTDTVSALRRSLLDNDRENPLILTIPRRGYQLRASIRWISRDGGVAFVAGSVIDGRPDWRLKQLLEQTDAHESWLAEDGRSRRIFRFCRNEQQLRKLRREVVLMRYLREALASRENVSTILDWQLDEPPYFLELAAPACGNLRGVMLGKSVPEQAERWRLMQDVAEALAAVHAAGVVHRNLSPDNVLVDRRGGERVALLGEFGLAALDDRQRLAALGIDGEDLSLKTGLLGPATAYTAPECVAGAPVSAASDVYALGVLIAQTLRGDFQRLESSGFEGLPDPIAGLLQRCVAPDPATRPTAAELSEGLRAWTQPKPAPRIAETVDVPTAPPAPVDPQPITFPAPAPVAATLPEAAAPPMTPVPLANQRIGRYRILDELAQGGMGVVYLAEQSEPVQRRVALQLIRAGLDSAQVLARFEAERQALALMNHPNISAIFDAGSTPGGYPYFVMEFIPGKDIKSYCDDAKLSLRARVRLFLQVCDGVLHAHQKGLIHRDLKPSNILVGQKSDRSPLVKLIDFGVAKSLTGSLSAGLHTRVGSFVGTPIYSSPEQVIDPTRDIDTRADLYSLGVVLYELLAGVPPRSAKDLDADTPAELARRLRDTKTPPMGSRYASLDSTERQRLAELRALSSDGLSMQLGSDLDWIVGKSIAQDPDDRYATVQDLRLDLQRWLDDRPVEARPASKLYQARKWMRRNRVKAGLVAGMILTLLVSVIVSTAGFYREQQARRDAERIAEFQSERLKSMDPAALGTQLRDSLTESLQTSENLNEDQVTQFLAGVNFTELSLQQLQTSILTPSIDEARKDFADSPIIRAQLLQAISEATFALGQYPTALELQEEVLRIRQEHLPPQDPRILQSTAAVAHTKWRMGRIEEAETGLRAVITQMEKALPPNDPMIPIARNKLANLLIESSRFTEAEALLQATLALQREHFPADDPELFETINSLGGVKYDLGQFVESKQLMTEALESRMRVLGPLNKSTLNSMNDLSLVLRKEGNFEEAEMWAKRSLDGYREISGRTHPDTIQLTANFAGLLNDLGRLEEAERYIRDYLSARRMVFGENHAFTLRSGVALANNHIFQGNADAALALLPDLIKKLDQLDEDTDGTRYLARSHLAWAKLMRGRLEEAQSELEFVIRAEATQTDALARIRFLAQSHLGAVYMAKGQWSKAEGVLRTAAAGLEQSIRPTNTAALLTLSRWSTALRRSGSLLEATEVSNRLLSLAEKAHPPGHYLLGVYRIVSGLNQVAAGKLSEAETSLENAWQLLSANTSADPAHLRDLLDAVEALDAELRRNRPEQALSTGQREWRAALAAAVTTRT